MFMLTHDDCVSGLDSESGLLTNIGMIGGNGLIVVSGNGLLVTTPLREVETSRVDKSVDCILGDDEISRNSDDSSLAWLFDTSSKNGFLRKLMLTFLVLTLYKMIRVIIPRMLNTDKLIEE